MPTVGPRVIVVAGQSNAMGEGDATTLTDPSEIALTLPNAAIGGLWAVSDNPTDPPAWNVGARGELRMIQSNHLGIEMSLGRAVAEALPLSDGMWTIDKFAVASTSLASYWLPSDSYPSSQPTDLYTQFVSHVQATLAATGGTLAAIEWVQGENDARDTTDAKAYLANLNAFTTALHESLGNDFAFVYGRLNAAAAGVDVADVRAAQEAFAQGDPGAAVAMVDQDPYPLNADHLHYPASSLIPLGQAYAAATATLLTPTGCAP